MFTNITLIFALAIFFMHHTFQLPEYYGNVITSGILVIGWALKICWCKYEFRTTHLIINNLLNLALCLTCLNVSLKVDIFEESNWTWFGTLWPLFFLQGLLIAMALYSLTAKSLGIYERALSVIVIDKIS